MNLSRLLSDIGLRYPRIVTAAGGLSKFVRDWRAYAGENADPRFAIHSRELFPIITDAQAQAGDVAGHYFHQDLWVAKKIFHRRPSEHLDVGSRIDGFIAHLLVFMPVTLVDIRPLSSSVAGLGFIQSDATTLAEIADSSVTSLSSLHAIEHFGLGRYGDPVDPLAWRKALLSFQRVLAVGGHLYVSVPIGRERVEFNAHRIFHPERLPSTLSELDLESFAAVDDSGHLRLDLAPQQCANYNYGCGIYEFVKR